jgi:hypothetical protein
MPRVRRLRLLPLLALLPLLRPASAAGETLTAREVLGKAVERQGKLAPGDVHDVTLTFEGEIQEKGETHTIVRTYWFRMKDRSFRVLTGSAAVDKSTDRGVLGAEGYWERTPKGRLLSLSRGNRDDRDVIRQIDDERAEFERMLRMVLLARLEDGWTLALGADAPVSLEADHPHEARRTLPPEPYYVLDATRDGEARLRLFVSTKDFTVRKAIEYAVDDPSRIQRVCYFAYGKPAAPGDIYLPWYFSVYRDTPSDDASRDELRLVWGQPKVALNLGLTDDELRPAG